MKGGLHYIDVHYKGVKIRQGWRHLLYHCFLAVYLVLLLSSVSICLYTGKIRILGFESLRKIDWISAGKCLVGCALFSGGLFAVLLVVLYPVWDYIANLQRLCTLIYASKWYLTNDILTPNMFAEERKAVKRELTYFPAFYYRKRRGMVDITVRLDGSKFHGSGELDKLPDLLQDVYALNIYDVSDRLNYRTFRLLADAARLRIHITDVVPERYRIPLMHGVSWDISKIPHALINGGTGGGKTFFLNILLRAFLIMGAKLFVCDPKNSSLADYKNILPDVSVTPDGIIKNVRACVSIMEQRQKEIKTDRRYVSGWDFTHYDLPPVILVLDEYVAFADSLTKKEKDEFKALVMQIVLKGREAGVFVLLATQRPDAEYLSGNVRDQLGLRVSLGKMSAEGYRMTFGTTDQKLRNKGVRGRGYIYMDGYAYIQEFYAPLVPDSYQFINEAATLLGVTPCASTPASGEASAGAGDQETGEAGFIVSEVIYDEARRS